MRLLTPECAGKVVARDIYWTVPFLELYLEECDQVGCEDPAAGYLLAIHAPSLARLIGVGERLGEYRSAQQKRSYEVLTLAVLAGMCRRVGKLTDAEATYQHAFRLCEGQPISVEARAELARRFALFLFRGQADPERKAEAPRYLEEAISLYESIGHRDGLAESFLTRGNWQCFQEEVPFGAVYYTQALGWADQTSPRGKRTFASALANLSYVLTLDESAPLLEHARALELLQDAKKRLGRQRRSRSKMMVLAMEGLLHSRLHFHRQAARLMSRAREGFAALGLPEDFAGASLELAIIYLEDGEPELFAWVREDTVNRFPQLSTDVRLLEIISQWDRTMRSRKQILNLRRALSGR